MQQRNDSTVVLGEGGAPTVSTQLHGPGAVRVLRGIHIPVRQPGKEGRCGGERRYQECSRNVSGVFVATIHNVVGGV